MKVVILCGGKGTRMKEEAEYRPKPMVPIGRFPILWHIMKIYAHHGHSEFILCLGYKGEMIRDYFHNYLWNTCDVTLSLGQDPNIEFHNDHKEEHWRVTLAETGLNSATSYRIHKIRQYLNPDEPFLLTYGDGVSDIDINASISEHKQSGKACTVTAVHPAGRFGAMAITEDGSIHTFMEKPQIEGSYVNGGFMICNYRMFDYITDDPNIMFEQDPLMRMTEDRQLHSYKHEGFWQCMDTYKEAQYLNSLWEAGTAPWKVW